MRRRRRPQREIVFGFDSFLDVVANVVGIILRLILVAWVGARTYKAMIPVLPAPPPALADPEPLPEPSDSREPLLTKRRTDLQRMHGAVEQQRGRLPLISQIARQLQNDLTELRDRRARVRAEQEKARATAEQDSHSTTATALTVAELRGRCQTLLQEIDKLRQSPSTRKELRYRTPVSAPVQSEELMFECHRGKISLIDHGAMLAEVKREVSSKVDDLRKTWQVTSLTAPVGSFRMRYVLERDRGPLDTPGGPPSGGTFRYGVTGWEVVPIQSERGESVDQALSGGSAFRRIIDSIEPQQTAVTIWVYDDSFAAYRALRDYLHEKGIVVAGRPLPEGIPIASSRHGTASRGQ